MPREATVHELPIAPHSVESEQSLLGALLLDGAHTWPRIAPILSASDFYRPDHRLAFSVIGELVAHGSTPDVTTVYAALERRGESEGAGGLAYLSRLARETPSSANAEAYARTVRDRAALRELLGVAEAIERAVHGSRGRGAADLVADAQSWLTSIQTHARVGSGLIESRVLASELIDYLESKREQDAGLRIGIPDFDALTAGLEPGDLVVFAARPGMGKTSLLVSISERVSRDGSVAVFSAEMPSRQLARRCVSLLGPIRQGRLKSPSSMTDADWDLLSRAATQFAERRLWIDDTPRPSLAHVRAECIALKARSGLSLVLVDYVQLMDGSGSNRYEQLRDVAYGCKALAKELAVPVIVLAQLNRSVEAREQKRPHMSDLRDSGAIEEAADIIGLLYSEGYYNREFPMPYVLECQIEKHRNGERGLCLWHFSGEFSRIAALEEGAAQDYRQLIAKRAAAHRGGDDL